MPKTSPSAGATTRLAGEVQKLAGLVKITRKDNVVKTFTDHDADLSFDDGLGGGPLTYEFDEGASSSAISSLFESSVDEMEITAFIQSGGIEYDDLISGRYDGADFRVYLVNWDDIADGGWKMRRGVIGNVNYDEGLVKFQFLGMLQKMHSTTIVGLVSAECRVKEFGDQGALYPQCKIQLNAATWQASTDYSALGSIRAAGDAGQGTGTLEVVVKPTSFNDRWFVMTGAGTSGGSEPSWNTTIGGTTSDGGVTWTTIQARRVEGASISTVTSHMEFVLTGYTGDAPDAFLTGGFVIFTSGENLNIKRGIAKWVLSTKTVTLTTPMNLLAIATDTVTLVSGCDRRVTTCVNTYDNINNFRGDPYLRGNDSFFRFPDAPPAS